MTVNCAIEAQGSLLALANRSIPAPRPPRTRGEVRGFSPASRRRLLRLLARVNAGGGLFVTLTFPAKFPDPPGAKHRLRALMERFRRRWPRAAAVWRMEAQERGAPHFHLIVFNIPFIPIELLRKWWEEINSDLMENDHIQIKIEKIRSARKLMYYVSKYCAKEAEHEYRNYDADLFFNDIAYLHEGRAWGVHNKSELPVRMKLLLAFSEVSYQQFEDVKRLMKARWDGINLNHDRGGVLFAADAYTLFAQAVLILRGNDDGTKS